MDEQVSVIIPTYNGAAYIADTIDSVLRQTYKDIELLVVDDGSTDRTREIVSAYGEPVRLITQANAGVSAARNRGIREARGEFVCLLDQDDYWYSDKLSRQLQTFGSHPDAGVVYSTFIVWAADSSGVFPAPTDFDPGHDPDGIDPEYSGWIYHQFLLDCWMLTSTAMFRAEVFRQCGDFDQNLPFSEDWELWLRIAREFPMIMLKRPTTLYRQHTGQENRRLREIDYRTRLLRNTADRWGLCSRDGRCLTRARFRKKLGEYHAAFGLQQIREGHWLIAARALGKAWLSNPVQLRYPAYLIAASIGWRPKW